MAQLLLSTGQNLHLTKRLTTVGSLPTCDVQVVMKQQGICLSISREERTWSVIPQGKIQVNANSFSKTVRLTHLDRLEWEGGRAVFLDQDATASSSGAPEDLALKALQILANISQTLQVSSGGDQAALHQTLDALIEMSGAEQGYLLTENAQSSGWNVIASLIASDLSRGPKKEIISHTLLNQSIEQRKLIYVENMIGHPLESSASIIASRIFSAACFPLMLGDRTLGAVLLMTQSPGRSIKRDSLAVLSLFAGQTALLLASSAQLRSKPRVGQSKMEIQFESNSPMKDVLTKLEKLAPTDLAVLIQGETGTGKELIAQEIHLRSNRSLKPFVALNCAAIPATLLESTLFGYERGAFTGADAAQPGKFLLADGGTIFLDEIGDLPLDLQSKLLRVIQEQQVEAIGARAPKKINVRVISATHQDLAQLTKNQKFRQDLYFRMTGATLSLPPLRDRPMDIAGLANRFISEYAPEKRLGADAHQALTQHRWPGNVRELQLVIKRAAFLSDGIEIKANDLEFVELEQDESQVEFGSRWLSTDMSLDLAQSQFTQEFVSRALDRRQGNRQMAAKDLGISERTLYRILASTEGSR